MHAGKALSARLRDPLPFRDSPFPGRLPAKPLREMAAGSVVSALSGRCLLQLEDVPATVGEVKQRVQDVLGIRKYKQRIFYEGALQGDYFELATLDQPLRLGLIEVPYAPVEETREDLGDAALQGNVAKLKSLLCLPANPNEGFGDPPLHLAFSCVSSGAMDLLLDALADPNCECQEYVDAVWAGTPLHLVTLAVEGEDDAAHATKILCDARADVNVSDSRGDAPLTLAARYGLWAVVGLLCAAKADLNFAAPERDGDCGNTPLQKAAWRDDVSMVHRLCELRADPNLPDENGITPLGAATIVAGQPRTAMLTLLEYRADVDAGRTSPLSLASACSTPRSGLDAEDRLGARLLLEAGASKEKALARGSSASGTSSSSDTRIPNSSGAQSKS